MILSAAITGFLYALPASIAIVAAAWLLLRICSGVNAATRHAVWWLVLLAVVILPLGFSLHDASGAAAWRRAVRVVPARTFASPAPVPQSPPVARRSNPVSAPAHIAPFVISPGGWAGGLFTIWALIFVVQFTRIAGSYLRLSGMKRRAPPASPELQQRFGQWMATYSIRRPARLLVSNEAGAPLAAGFFHPAVMVPARLLNEFGPAELDHVLLHELCHLDRRDDWANLLCRVAFAALWFHPAAVVALRRIEREREMACDEWVVAATGAARPYAASLARLFEFCIARRSLALASGMAGHGSHLGERIEVLVRRKDTRRGGVSLLLLAACAFGLMVIIAAAAHAPRWIRLAQERPRLAMHSAPNPHMAVLPRVMRAVPPGPSSFLAGVVAAGYGDLSVDEIIQLRRSGVTGQYLIAVGRSGFGKPTPGDIVTLHNSGVSAEFLEAAKNAIPDLALQDVIELHNNGVSSAYMAQMQAAGAGRFSKDQMVSMHRSGVQPALVTALRDAGVSQLNTSDIIEAQRNGLCAADLRRARRYGGNLSMDQIIRLKRAGVL